MYQFQFITKGIQNPGFIRDVEYFRNNAPTSIPQPCFPSRSIHHRLPSPTNGSSFMNNKLYGNDTLNDDDDDSNVDTECGIMKQDSSETIRNTMSSLDITNEKSLDDAKKDTFESRQSSQDNDSGHLSLEVSTSPNASTPPDRSLQPPPPLAPIFKENPFKVNSSRAPNKIILDPIHLPAVQTESIIDNSSVPRHLFTVKKS